MEQMIVLNRQDLKDLIKEFASEATHNEKKTEIFLTTEEACHMAKISRPTLHRWKKSGLIPYVKIGKNVRYRQSELIEALNKSRVHGK